MPACRWLQQACGEEKAMSAAREGGWTVGLVFPIEGMEKSRTSLRCGDVCRFSRFVSTDVCLAQESNNTAAVYMFIFNIYMESEDTPTDIQDTFNATSPVLST
jgi:hypothetical protein